MHRQYCPDVFIFCACKCVKCSFFPRALTSFSEVFAFFICSFVCHSCKHILERKHWVAYTLCHFVTVVRPWGWSKLLLQFHISGKSSAECLLYCKREREKKPQQSFLIIILIITTFGINFACMLCANVLSIPTWHLIAPHRTQHQNVFNASFDGKSMPIDA